MASPSIVIKPDAPKATLYGFSPYDEWMKTIGIPIHRTYFIDDLRTTKLGRWEARGADAAFIELEGQQGVTGAYLLELGPGQTSAPFRIAVDECAYVLEGGGLTTISAADGRSKSFEWHKHSLFMLPSNLSYQLANTSGNRRARLLVCSYFPLALSVMPNTEHFFNNPIDESPRTFGKAGEFYSQASFHPTDGVEGGHRVLWQGNFFPDLRSFDKLDALDRRGAGGKSIWMDFPGSPVSAHMSVFPPLTYKKAHRHGPGFVIVIPVGEGYSLMWPEGEKPIEIQWHEGSCFVPPARWFHQHFNTSDHPDRYLAIHPPRRQMSISGELDERKVTDQIEYTEEDPWIREKFAQELAKRGLKSRMPEEAYRERDYKFKLMD